MSDGKEPKVKRVPAAAKATLALAEPAAVVALPLPMRRRASGEAFLATYQRMLASMTASQSAVASDVTAMALEMHGLARTNLTAAGESLAALFGARSLVDAVEIQLGFARRSLDAMVDGSTKLGEIGLRLANDATKPMLTPFAAN